jgi:phosphoribosylaminoimidazolecarboxamide formyltransferase/IMP cyclohydrolase
MSSVHDAGMVPFELVVVNLYPFEETVARKGVIASDAVEQIDIGGPALMRAAAKNHEFVTIASDPSQYGPILEQIKTDGRTSLELRRELAFKAFSRTAQYDQAIAAFLGDPSRSSIFPRAWTVSAVRRSLLRYGENPHQPAALYAWPHGAQGTLVSGRQLCGKELSYNNLLDLHSALAIVRTLTDPAVAVVKHNNPCGAAADQSLRIAAEQAWNGDPLSAFGSVLGMNRTLDAETADWIAGDDHFVEAIVAPDFDPQAVEVLTTKPTWRSSVRLVAVGSDPPAPQPLEIRSIDGGLLLQQPDDQTDLENEWRVVTDAQPADASWRDLRFAWRICRHVKSNAIVLVSHHALVGVGAGQTSRVDAVRQAIDKAGPRSRGSVLASDAFFPFDDSIHRAAEAAVAAIIQPGGSRRDEQVIAACNAHRLPMVFTGRRHFRH